MKKRFLAMALGCAMAVTVLAGCGGQSNDQKDAGNTTSATEEAADGKVYQVGIVQYVDDASLNQIVKAVKEELDAKGKELGVTFDYANHTYNGQADATVMNQIASDLINDNVDAIVQAATEETQTPVVFSAVSDPVIAGLVESMDKPGSNITGTSDMLDTDAIMDLMLAAQPDIKKVGLLYDKGQDSSTQPIADAKAYLDAKGIEYVEKTGTTNDEVSLAADALIAAGCEAVFTPTDNTVMTAELAIFEKFQDAKVPQYCGADSFALNGAFCGYGVNYEELGKATADMVVDILVNGADPATTPVQTMNNGIATINTDTAEKIGLDYSMFATMCEQVKETTTAQEFE